MYSQKFTPCHCPVITLLLQWSIKTYFLVVHPLLQNILNLPPIMMMIMIMTTTMMIKYCAVGICRGSHESLLVWDLNTKEISVHVHVPLYCSLGPIPMIHTFQLQIDPSSHQHPASIQRTSQILFSLGYSHTWRIPDATDRQIEQNIMKPKICHKLIHILQSILAIPHQQVNQI